MADCKKKTDDVPPAVPAKEPLSNERGNSKARDKPAPSTTATTAATTATAASKATGTPATTTTTTTTSTTTKTTASTGSAKSSDPPETPPKDDMGPGSGSGGRVRHSSKLQRSKQASYSEAVTAAAAAEKQALTRSSNKGKGSSVSENTSKLPHETGSKQDGDLPMLDLDPGSVSLGSYPTMDDEHFQDAIPYQMPTRGVLTASPGLDNVDLDADFDEAFAEYDRSTRRGNSTGGGGGGSGGGIPAGVRDDMERMQRSIADLTAQLSIISNEKDSLRVEKVIAEERAERTSKRLDDMKNLVNSDVSDLGRKAQVTELENEKLKKENEALREQLSDAQSHIFSLQPYRKELTPKEVSREYENLVELVQSWVEKFMDPWLDSLDEGPEAIVNLIRKRSAEVNTFRRTLYKYPDLMHASMFPETDVDIIVSIILRYLHDNIFQTTLYNTAQHYTGAVSFIENSMQISVQPKRDLFSVRTWTAEAYEALLSDPQFEHVREKKRREMTKELCAILKVFFPKDKIASFLRSLDDNCVWPAMQLYEKLQVSTHHFYLDINSFISKGHGGDMNLSPEFYESLDKLDCRNILQARKAFVLRNFDPVPTTKELYHHLVNVCTVVPALYMRQIGQKDAIKEPMIIRPQTTLVAWGPEEKRRKFMENGGRPVVWHLYHAQTERQATGASWSIKFL